MHACVPTDLKNENSHSSDWGCLIALSWGNSPTLLLWISGKMQKCGKNIWKNNID